MNHFSCEFADHEGGNTKFYVVAWCVQVFERFEGKIDKRFGYEVIKNLIV